MWVDGSRWGGGAPGSLCVFERAVPDVSPVIHPIEMDLRERLVRAIEGLLQRIADGGHAQHSAATGDELIAGARGSGMKYFDAGSLRGIVESADRQAGLVAAGIA